MKDLMFFIIVVSPLLFCIYCAWKEAEVSAPYRIFNIYGRVKVYLFTDFIAVAIVGFGSVIYSIFSKTKTDYGFLVMSVLFIFIGIGVSVFIYRSTKSKCPNGPLKDKLLISMIISGVGITFNLITQEFPRFYKRRAELRLTTLQSTCILNKLKK